MGRDDQIEDEKKSDEPQQKADGAPARRDGDVRHPRDYSEGLES